MWLPGWRHVFLPETGSTNQDALEAFQQGDHGRLWVRAGLQTKGLGRRGRSWHSPAGNLYCSLLLVDPAPAAALASLPLIAALALHDALAKALPSHKRQALRIKWPNDILLDGGKLAGILLQSSTAQGGRTGVAIGFGVNCTTVPDQTMYPTASLAGAGVDANPTRLFENLSLCFERVLANWDEGRGFADLRRRWLERAAGLGEPITARFADHEEAGLFRDIDEQGYLMLESRNGDIKRISTADIFLGPPHLQSA